MALHTIFDAISYPHILLTSSVLIATYLLYTAVYRLYFHPLAKYPGPLLGRLTAWHSYYHTLKLDRHSWMYELQEKYGPTFRYRPDGIVVNTPEGYKTIFGNQGNVKKAVWFYRTWPHTDKLVNTWNTTSFEIHARKRRVLSNALSDRALREAEPLFHANIDRWLDLLKDQIGKGEEWSRSVNMADQANYLVFDILGDLNFGKSFDMKEPGNELRHVPGLLSDFVQLAYSTAVSPYADWWVWLKPRGLDWLLQYALPKSIINWQKFVGAQLENRTAAEQELKRSGKGESAARKDFFHHLWNAKDPETGEQGYTTQDLWIESELLIAAGADTTSIFLAAATFYLAKNPKAQEKLSREVNSTFRSYDEINASVGTKLYDCKYLRAFINEVLRMAPPVPADLPREVLPGGTTVEGNFYPPGTIIGTSLYCLSHNKDIYDDPFKFRPERWLTAQEDADGDAAEKVALAETAICPFSMGTRGCLGKNVAWMEMLLVVSKMVYTFEMKQDPTSLNLGGGGINPKPHYRDGDRFVLGDAFVAVRNGPMIQLKERIH